MYFRIKSKSVLFLLFFFFNSSYLMADTDFSQWNMFIARIKHSNNFRSFIDLQPRTVLDGGKGRGGAGFRQMLFRPAVGYQVSDHLQIFQGYTVIDNYEPHKTEHDSIQDFVLTSKLSDISFVHRLRLEQRFLEGQSEVAHRWRLFTRGQWPIPCWEKFSLVAFEEGFYNLNSLNAGPQEGFKENRAFAGLSYSLSPTVQVDLGYQNQYIDRSAGKSDIYNHSLYLAVAWAVDMS